MFSSRLHTAADADAPTPPDSDGDMNLCPDIEPECDQDPSPGPEIEEQREELEPLSGRQKASAQLKPIHPPTVIAKLCSSAFKKSSRRILENGRENYAVPPGTQPDAMVSDDLRVGMKRAAADISRSKFEVYNFATRHDLSEAAIDELLQMLSNVGNILVVVLSKVFVFTLACLDGLDSKLLPIVCRSDLNHRQSLIRQ